MHEQPTAPANRRASLQAVRPLSPNQTSLPVTITDGRGFTCLTDFDDGQIPGEATPSNPKGSPRASHDQRLMFERLFKEQSLSLDELTPYRVRTAWRAVRYICVKLGVLTPDLLLGSLPTEAPQPTRGIDLFYRPYQAADLTPPHPDRPTRKLMELVRLAGDQGEPVAYQRLSPTGNALEIHHRPGFTLLPTVETAEYWAKAIDVAEENLFLSRGSIKDRDQGRYGLLGLTDPALCPLACPTLPEMLMWELFLVDEVTTLLASTGEHLIDTTLREHYGLLPDETRAVIAQARRAIRERTDLDIEEQRALMVMRIQDVIHRAQQALDPRAELAGLKLLSQTVGLTKAEPKDIKALFKQVVNEAANTRRIDYASSPAQLESDDD